VIWECAVFGEDEGGDERKPRAVGRMVHVFVSKTTGKGVRIVPEAVRTGVEKLVVQGVEGDEVGGVEGDGRAKL